LRRYFWQSFTSWRYSILALMSPLSTIVTWWFYWLLKHLNFWWISFSWNFSNLYLTLLITRFILCRLAKSSLFGRSTWWKTNWIRVILLLLLHGYTSVNTTLWILRTLSLIWTWQLVRAHNLLRYVLKTLLSFLFSAFSEHYVVGLSTWCGALRAWWFMLIIQVSWIIHFVYHLNSTRWSLNWPLVIIVAHKYVLGSQSCNSIVWWNYDPIILYIILYFWLLLSEVHHASRPYHRLLMFLIRISCIVLILIFSHSHCYASSIVIVYILTTLALA